MHDIVVLNCNNASVQLYYIVLPINASTCVAIFVLIHVVLVHASVLSYGKLHMSTDDFHYFTVSLFHNVIVLATL